MTDKELFPEVPKRARPRDEVWDALVDIFGQPTTRSSRSNFNRIVASLKEAGANYAEIHRRAVTWPAHFPGATLTENALEKHWDRLGRMPLRATELQGRELDQEIDRARMRAWAAEQEDIDEKTRRGDSLPDRDGSASSERSLNHGDE